MTIQANQGFGVSIFGATSAGGGGSTSPGGSSGQVQYNNGGSFGGMSGTTWTDASQSLAIASIGAGTGVTTSSPVLNLTQTWNGSGVTFTGLKFNATDTASASGSLLLDLQVGGSSKVVVTKTGTINTIHNGNANVNLIPSAQSGMIQLFNGNVQLFSDAAAVFNIVSSSVRLAGGQPLSFSTDLFLTRAAAATLQLGAADAAAPVAQTLQVQSVVAGTTNTAGTNFTIAGSKGTGTGAGGSIIFQVAPAGSTGSAQNAYSTALTINSNGRATFAPTVDTTNSFAITNVAGSVIASVDATNRRFMAGGGASNASFSVSVATGATTLYDAGYFGWMNGADASSGTTDVRLYRDAANTLALRNGTNAQTFRVYETYTDASNYSQYFFGATGGGDLAIGTAKAGTGQARAIWFYTNSTISWVINTSQHLLAGVDNAYDIGASGTTNRVRTFYSGGGYSAAGPSIKTANYSQGIHDYSLIFNGSGSITLTLLAAATYPGKVLYVKTIAAQTVVSASSNVKPIDSDTAGTAILAATAGKWAMLQSDGTNWVVMAQG